jgi:hypothetical protein
MIDTSDSGTAPPTPELHQNQYNRFQTIFFAIVSIYVGVYEVLLLRAAHASQIVSDPDGGYFRAITHLGPWVIALACRHSVRRAAVANAINPRAEYLCYNSINWILLVTHPIIASLYPTSIRTW